MSSAVRCWHTTSCRASGQGGGQLTTSRVRSSIEACWQQQHWWLHDWCQPPDWGRERQATKAKGTNFCWTSKSCALTSWTCAASGQNQCTHLSRTDQLISADCASIWSRPSCVCRVQVSLLLVYVLSALPFSVTNQSAKLSHCAVHSDLFVITPIGQVSVSVGLRHSLTLHNAHHRVRCCADLSDCLSLFCCVHLESLLSACIATGCSQSALHSVNQSINHVHFRLSRSSSIVRAVHFPLHLPLQHRRQLTKFITNGDEAHVPHGSLAADSNCPPVVLLQQSQRWHFTEPNHASTRPPDQQAIWAIKLNSAWHLARFAI